MEHGIRATSAGMPYTVPYVHEDIDGPTFGGKLV